MPAGHPPIFKSPEELQAKVDEFCVESLGKGKKLTITGLCLHLGFESRQSFYDYESRPEFSYTVKRARMIIENEYEQRLFENANAGAIFALKNFGWTDKQEIDQTVKGDWTISMNINGGNKVRKALDAGISDPDN